MTEYQNMDSTQNSVLGSVRDTVSDNLYSALADVGRYASLLYGVSQVVGDDPNIGKAALGGVVYLLASLVYGLSNQKKSKEVAFDIAKAQTMDLENIMKG